MSIENTIRELETKLNELKESIKPKKYKLTKKMQRLLTEKMNEEVYIELALVNDNTIVEVMSKLIELFNTEEGLEGVKYDDIFIDFNGTCIPERYLECIS